MNSKVLSFVNKLEGYKTAIKQLHWSADNMSQHKLCDDIASRVADFQDQVSEVEQSISGKFEKNKLKPTEYKVTTLKKFVEDVLDATHSFYKNLGGDDYVGMRSDCESFLSDMQRNLYLVDFTMKEDLRRRLKGKINESMPKNLGNHDEVDKFMGRKPKSIQARINQIYRIVKKYGIDSRVYHDENWQAISDYYRAISSLGCEVEMKPCGHIENADSIESDGGYCDYGEDGMPRSKQYAISIMFEDGMRISGYIKCMAAGTVADPFSRYDTCIVLWPKNNRILEGKVNVEESINEYGDKKETREKMGMAAKRDVMKGKVDTYQNAINSLGKRGSSKEDYNDMQKGFEMSESRQYKLTEAELKQIVKEAAIKVLTETPLNYDIDNFSGRWSKSNPSDEDMALADVQDDYLDDPFNAPNSWDDDDWVDGDKEMENEYSWDRFDNKPIAHGVGGYYNTLKGGVDNDIDTALNRRNNDKNWSDRELMRGKGNMNAWVNGRMDTDELEHSWDVQNYLRPHYKFTESELKGIVKEAAMNIIKEYTQKQANTKRFIRSTHGHRGNFKKEPTPEERAEARRRLGIKDDVEESIEIDDNKKGTFTAAANKHGESVQGFASKVLKNKGNYSPAMVKKANFAKNASKWNKK